jgi:murein L,D-transpeptidase YafK
MKTKKYYFIAIICLAVFCLSFIAYKKYEDFISEQKKYEKVRKAYVEKESYLTKKLKEKNLSLQNLNILMVAYKDEGEFEVYVKSKTDKAYQKFLTYAICSNSGDLGSKNKGSLTIFAPRQFCPNLDLFLMLKVVGEDTDNGLQPVLT